MRKPEGRAEVDKSMLPKENALQINKPTARIIVRISIMGSAGKTAV